MVINGVKVNVLDLPPDMVVHFDANKIVELVGFGKCASIAVPSDVDVTERYLNNFVGKFIREATK